MALLTDIAAAVHSVDEAQPLDNFRTMESVVAREIGPWRFNAAEKLPRVRRVRPRACAKSASFARRATTVKMRQPRRSSS